MAGDLQPLDDKFPIVGPDGRPTLYFIEWAQQRQIDITDSITSEQFNELLLQYLLDHQLQEGSGIQITPSGNISDSPTIAADVQEILDQISVTRGSVIYRGLLGWAALAPGTAGQFLQTAGPAADPLWATGGGGGGSGMGEAPLTPPSAASFTWLNQGTATVNDAGNGVHLNAPNAGATQIRGQIKAIANADFDIKFRLKGHTSNSSSPAFGLILYNSTSGRLLVLNRQPAASGGILFQRWTNVTTFSATIATFSTTGLWGEVPWLRVTRVGTTLTVFCSLDGFNWLQIATETIGTFLTATGGTLDNAGFQATIVNGVYSAVLCQSLSGY